jgi:hypothetical protein
MDSDHLLIMFSFWIILRLREILDPVEKFTDWEQFQSLASALVSPRVEINSCIEVDKAARDFAASISSTTKTTISDHSRGPSGLERLLEHKKRPRKLWKETRDLAYKTSVNWVTKTTRRMTQKRELERWGEKR